MQAEYFLIMLGNFWLPGKALAIFLIFLLMRKIFTNYIFKVTLKLLKKTGTDFGTSLLLAFEKPLQLFFIILGAYTALLYLPLSMAMDFFVSKLFRSLLVFVFSAGFYNLVDHESILLGGVKTKFNFQAENILMPFLSKLLRFLIIFLAVTMVAREWGFDVNGFITGLGLGGLAFALAAQDTLSNFFGGIVIITDRPFAIGDWIDTPGVEGTVEDISFRSTKIRTFAQALVTMPNSSLARQPITNWSRMGRRRITFNLGVTYTTPGAKLQKCTEEIRNMLTNHPSIHQETIFVNFNEFNESSLDIFLYFFTTTTNWGEYLNIKEDVNFKIMEILEKEGVSVAFPSRSLYLEKPVEISLPGE